jgi:DNA-binding transcriptional regulator GbsR (MarR family)
MSKQQEQTLTDLAVAVGEFIEYWGYKKVHGQVWMYLYLKKDPISSAELKQKLGISKALLSMTLADLKAYNVVLTQGKGKHGAELLYANPDLVDGILKVLKKREKQMIEKVAGLIDRLVQLPKQDLEQLGISQQRLLHLGKFVHFGQYTLNSILKLGKVSFKTWRSFKELI